MTLPQIIAIWFTDVVSGVSLFSWTSFLFFSCVWLVYGIANKIKPVIFNSILWIIVQSLVVLGIIVRTS